MLMLISANAYVHLSWHVHCVSLVSVLFAYFCTILQNIAKPLQGWTRQDPRVMCFSPDIHLTNIHYIEGNFL